MEENPIDIRESLLQKYLAHLYKQWHRQLWGGGGAKRPRCHLKDHMRGCTKSTPRIMPGWEIAPRVGLGLRFCFSALCGGGEAEINSHAVHSCTPPSSALVQQVQCAPFLSSAVIEGTSALQFEHSLWKPPSFAFRTNEEPQSLLGHA